MVGYVRMWSHSNVRHGLETKDLCLQLCKGSVCVKSVIALYSTYQLRDVHCGKLTWYVERRSALWQLIEGAVAFKRILVSHSSYFLGNQPRVHSASLMHNGMYLYHFVHFQVSGELDMFHVGRRHLRMY